MAEIVRLKHITRQNDWKFYFYSGHVPVKGGVIELPADQKTWIRRAWLMGFRLTEDGQPISANRYADIVAAATVTDSQEEPNSEPKQKSSNRRRQPRLTNGVRQGQSGSGGNADAIGTPSSVSSGAGEQSDEPAATAGDGSEVSTSG